MPHIAWYFQIRRFFKQSEQIHRVYFQKISSKITKKIPSTQKLLAFFGLLCYDVTSAKKVQEWSFFMLKKLSAIFTIVNSCCIIGLSMANMITAEAAYAANTETVAYENLLVGDVDSDGNVNVLDAASILSESVSLGSDDQGTFTDEQFYCADVNKDEKLNALDVSIILNFSSFTGASSADDFAAYLEQLGLPQEGTSQDAPAQPEESPAPTDPPQVETPETTPSQPEESEPTGTIVSLTESEATMLAALVTLEAGAESYECQKAVASLVINRMLTSNSSLSDVIYAKNQFSVAGKVATTKPFDSCVKAVNDVLTNGTTLPIYVTFFRAGYYHSWGDQVAYCCIDNTYFSYSKALMNKYAK